jgi:gas vesicle protein
MAKDNNVGQKVVLGALIAGAAGYLAGVLTAPKSGKETRTDIADKADDIKRSAATELAELQEELKDLLKKSKDQTTALTGKAKDEFNEAVLRAKDAQDKAASVLKAVKAGEASDPELNKAVKQAKLAGKNLSRYLKS